MIKKFISLCVRTKYQMVSVFLALFLPLTSFAQFSSNSPAVDLLTRTGLFIKTLVIPVLFGIAFLFFLINMTRYYIIGGANEESRTKARRSTLYGLFAFVFLMSLWGIITMLLGGIGVDKTSSICPDYLKECGEDVDRGGKGVSGRGGSVTFPGADSGGGISGGTTGGTSGSTGGGGTNGNSGGTSGGTGGNTGSTNFSGLSELIFGTGKDSALFTRYAGDPRAVYQTPAIATNATCASGLNTLLLANRVETSQAAYVLYKDNSGATRWKNITDLSSTNHIAYDKDALDTLLRTNATDITVLHTHPKKRSESLGLIMEGHGPSSADMKAMCNNSDTSISYGVVGWDGVWSYQQQTDTCPYSVTAGNILPVIETYGALASLEASTRQSELFGYINSPVTPIQYKNHFSGVDTQQFPSLVPEEVLALSDYYQTYASTTVSYSKSVDAFCGAF